MIFFEILSSLSISELYKNVYQLAAMPKNTIPINAIIAVIFNPINAAYVRDASNEVRNK